MRKYHSAAMRALLILSLIPIGMAGAEEWTFEPPLAQSQDVRYLDIEQAKFLRQKAEGGDAAMQCLYGLSLLNGSSGRIDADEGERWLKLSADAGDPRGQFEYGKMLYLGLGRERDQPASIAYLRPSAERGSFEAAYYLGGALLLGEGVDHTPAEGVRWLEQAADAGLRAAQSDLGIAYYTGLPCLVQDYIEAARWFTLAARQGNGDSANKLGVMHRFGHGVEEDPAQAMLWFCFGANLGDPFAQFNLASSYMNGEWVRRDFVMAARWFEQSARQGNPDAQYYLGCFYAEGVGVPRDPGVAREILTLSARGGNAQAEELLEILYETDDDGSAGSREPLWVGAADLLRETALSPLIAPERGREVYLGIGSVVEVSASPEGGAYYLTIPGYPGVIHCEIKDGVTAESLKPGMVLHGVAAGPSPLPGFIRLEQCAVDLNETIGLPIHPAFPASIQ